MQCLYIGVSIPPVSGMRLSCPSYPLCRGQGTGSEERSEAVYAWEFLPSDGQTHDGDKMSFTDF